MPIARQGVVVPFHSPIVATLLRAHNKQNQAVVGSDMFEWESEIKCQPIPVIE
jgi:hypothetical protein